MGVRPLSKIGRRKKKKPVGVRPRFLKKKIVSFDCSYANFFENYVKKDADSNGSFKKFVIHISMTKVIKFVSKNRGIFFSLFKWRYE